MEYAYGAGCAAVVGDAGDLHSHFLQWAMNR